jgi:carbon storage regulator
MLVLSRKRNEEIVIDNQIRVVVLDMSAHAVRLGIEAPRHISVHRGEVQRRIVSSGPRQQLAAGQDAA